MISAPDHPLLAFGMPNGADMMIIAILVLILFGARKLPTFYRSLGRSMSEFQRSKEDFERELRETSHPGQPREFKPDDPHARANFVISIILLLSLLFLLISIIDQVMAQH